MRAAVLVGLVVIACGGSQDPDTAIQQPAALTAASWYVENETVICPGATRRYEWANATNEVREPGTGDLVVCTWSCATYDAMFGGRRLTADHNSVYFEFLRTDDSRWIAIEQSSGEGSCLVQDA